MSDAFPNSKNSFLVSRIHLKEHRNDNNNNMKYFAVNSNRYYYIPFTLRLNYVIHDDITRYYFIEIE